MSTTFYYATKEEVSGKYFDGELIPSDNTIKDARLTFVMQQAQDDTNRAGGFALGTEDDDATGILKKVFLYYVGLELKRKDLTMPDWLERELSKNDGEVPLVVYDPLNNRL